MLNDTSEASVYDRIIEDAALCFAGGTIQPMDDGYYDRVCGQVRKCCLVTAAFITNRPTEDVDAADVRDFTKDHFELTEGEFEALVAGFDNKKLDCFGSHATAYEAGQRARERFLRPEVAA